MIVWVIVLGCVLMLLWVVFLIVMLCKFGRCFVMCMLVYKNVVSDLLLLSSVIIFGNDFSVVMLIFRCLGFFDWFS